MDGHYANLDFVLLWIYLLTYPLTSSIPACFSCIEFFTVVFCFSSGGGTRDINCHIQFTTHNKHERIPQPLSENRNEWTEWKPRGRHKGGSQIEQTSSIGVEEMAPVVCALVGRDAHELGLFYDCPLLPSWGIIASLQLMCTVLTLTISTWNILWSEKGT